MGLLVLNIT